MTGHVPVPPGLARDLDHPSLVIDDAIIVVENVQRVMKEEGVDVVEATRRTMRQVTGPIVATTLVLAALFVPIGFLAGITGQLYRQFAVTLLVTITFSTINALTLSPALCALLLRPPTENRGRVFGAFNRALDTSRNWYLGLLARLGRQLVLASVLVLAMFGGIYGLFRLLRLTTEDRYE